MLIIERVRMNRMRENDFEKKYLLDRRKKSMMIAIFFIKSGSNVM